MSIKRFYIGNLPFEWGTTELKAEAQKYGEVVYARVIEDHQSGESRGFGFIEMADDAGAEAVVFKMSGSIVTGDNGPRDLRVKQATPRLVAGEAQVSP